jgi:hypothetical protein
MVSANSRALAARGRGVQVPAGREDALAAPGDDRHAQLVVVSKGEEGLAEGTAGERVDGVGLGPGLASATWPRRSSLTASVIPCFPLRTPSADLD